MSLTDDIIGPINDGEDLWFAARATWWRTDEARTGGSMNAAVAILLTPEQQNAITIAEGAKRLLDLFIADIRGGCFLAADRDRKQAYELVRALGPAWLDAIESVRGPMSECSGCGHLEVDCQCVEDICFAEGGA